MTYTNEAQLTACFAEWKKEAGEAAPVFRQTEAAFIQKARHETFDKARRIYESSARWYGARAARCELRQKMFEPAEVKEEREKIRRMVEACRFLREFVLHDPHYFKDPSADDSDLKALHQAFASVSSVINRWTDVLVQDMEAEKKSK